ncbi:uncharacterized protein LOC122088710 [Macadamia integrifolia]|uniref:uncharacterized protein LOC122088710 n=1 Tax=Macadamia integrifolia TaxID=60698 RepID=UPI001C4ED0D7|nr:uncharacterized protein LOC122088710 [Macadamia integrifolia]
MLYTLISTQLLVEKRSRLISTLSAKAQKLWNRWELRLAVLLSLFFQILLILLGDSRRNNKRLWVQIVLWIAYLCADWVAAVALGILSHSTDQTEANLLPPFWAPFLLLHLGGPDTITAFSLEDNELWLRHLLGLGVQGSIASYVSYRSWTGTLISILSVLMYVPAIVKYGERTWVLSSASKEHLRDSMLSPPDPGPSYAKFMDEYNCKEEDGFRVTINGRTEESPQTPPATDDRVSPPSTSSTTKNDSNDNDVDVEILVTAHKFFEIYRRLFAFLILSFDDWEESKSFFQQISYKEAFNLIDIELGFMFDVLYTKAPVAYSITGSILRSISFTLTIIVFVMFMYLDKHHHPPSEVIITYLLLSLAIVLEIYAAIRLISSDSALLWLNERGLLGKRPANLLLKYCRCRRTRWSNSVKQYNLLRVWLKDDKPAVLLDNRICKYFNKLLKALPIHKKLKKYRYTTYKKVPDDLKEFIFQQLRIKSDKAINFTAAKELCKCRGGEVLRSMDVHGLLKWSIDDVEFDQSILIWHIATDLCYDQSRSDSTYNKEREISKLLSDYMLYLLIVCPFMLPEGIGEIRYLDTEAEAMNFFSEKKEDLKRKRPSQVLLEVKTDIAPIEVKGPKSKSVLFDACRLANQLQKGEKIKDKWKIISCVWVEMLSYAAVQCKGPNHAQQLGQGGELLTHVWLLMAHLGITEQFQMPTGFARKLTYI